MRHSLTCAMAATFLIGLAGCASPDHVLFVTKTSVGVDFDSKPSTASLAYDRIEGYIAPVYANGESPPVVASIKSDGKIFNPAIRQIYATGDAAVIATGGTASRSNQPLKGGGDKLMFFGTTTTTGLKVGFTTGLPDSFVFGFKRKEFSYIPLATVGTDGASYDVYPSVLASIDTAATVPTDGKTGDAALTNAQLFATGEAARLLAKTKSITDGFTSIAREAMLKQQVNLVHQAQTQADATNTVTDNIRAQYTAATTSAAQKAQIVADAKAAGLDLDNAMNVDNFLQHLAANTSRGDQAIVQQQLKTLQDRVNALLTN